MAKLAANNELVTAYLKLLNDNWKLYDDIENHKVTFDTYTERMLMIHRVSETYLYAELWLAQHGWPYQQLAYDKATKTYSLPEQGEHANDER